jgi:hypothetical protein
MKQFISILKQNFLLLILIPLLILMPMRIAQGATSPSNSFLHHWQGTWSGTMYQRSIQGQSLSLPMTFKIQQISNNPLRYTWQITYGAGA